MDERLHSQGGLDPARRRRAGRARRWVGLAVLLALGAGILAVRFHGARGGQTAALALGARALREALEGRRSAFAEARVAFQEATGSLLLDPYPLFALELTDKLEQGRPLAQDPRLQPVLQALARGQIDEADRLLEAAREAPGYGWLRRLLDDMRISRS